jgi:putative ABC transport system permease protein
VILLLLAFALQGPARTIAIDERLAHDASISIGDTVFLSAEPGVKGEPAVVSGIQRRSADPSEIARGDYRIRMHLTQLQSLLNYGDRVDRFAISARDEPAVDSALQAINRSAFGFQPHRSRDVAVETSRTFQVVSRFHRAIGVITIVASMVFLVCIMLLKVEERRREIAALRLFGISRRSVLTAISIEASLVAFVGSVIGGCLGIVISAIVNHHYQGVYRTPLIFAIVTPDILIFSLVLSIVLGVAAGIIVSLRLVHEKPLELIGR